MEQQPITIATIADVLEHGYSWTAHCRGCDRHQVLDLEALAARLGSDFPAYGRRLPLRCSSCGARDVGVLVA